MKLSDSSSSLGKNGVIALVLNYNTNPQQSHHNNYFINLKVNFCSVG